MADSFWMAMVEKDVGQREIWAQSELHGVPRTIKVDLVRPTSEDYSNTALVDVPPEQDGNILEEGRRGTSEGKRNTKAKRSDGSKSVRSTGSDRPTVCAPRHNFSSVSDRLRGSYELTP